MIREAETHEKSAVYELWKQSWPNRDPNELAFYFKHCFNDGTCIVMEEDARIISSLMMHPHVLHFQGMRLCVSTISGISTSADYRRRGKMRELMESALDEAQHNNLITMIQAIHPKLYERFGFQVVYERKTYCIHYQDLSKIDPVHVSTSAQAKELYRAYRTFITHFEGALQRSIKDYELLLQEVEAGLKNLIVYRDRSGIISGYLLYEIKQNEIFVKEAIYRNAMSLQRMLKKAIGKHESLYLEVSASEQLEKIFPLAIGKRSAYMMARINHYPLFNKLFNTNVKSAKEAFGLLKRPLWIHELR